MRQSSGRAGLIVVAAAPWAILHHYGMRGWPVAIGLGAVLTFLVVFGFLTNGFGAYVASGNLSAADSGGPTWVNGRKGAVVAINGLPVARTGPSRSVIPIDPDQRFQVIPITRSD
jgi:hypothetical protein